MAFFNDRAPGKVEISPVGPLSKVMARLYADLDRRPLPSVLRGYPKALEAYICQVYAGCEQAYPKFEDKKEVVVATPVEESADTIVGFSGGRDSLSTALQVNRAYGKRPILFHVKNINKSYATEHARAETLANYAGFPFVTAYARASNGSSFNENPTKDQLILAMMIDHGIGKGVRRYSMGVEDNNWIVHSNIEYNYSDAVEMFLLWHIWSESVYPNKFEWYVKGLSHTMLTIFEEDPRLLDYTMSCLTPHRFQVMRRRITKEKFKVELLPNRCGVCWKCCAEYMNLVALGEEPVVPFLKYCFERFVACLPQAYTEGFGQGMPQRKILEFAVDSRYVDTNKIAEYLGIKDE